MDLPPRQGTMIKVLLAIFLIAIMQPLVVGWSSCPGPSQVRAASCCESDDSSTNADACIQPGDEGADSEGACCCCIVKVPERPVPPTPAPVVRISWEAIPFGLLPSYPVVDLPALPRAPFGAVAHLRPADRPAARAMTGIWLI